MTNDSNDLEKRYEWLVIDAKLYWEIQTQIGRVSMAKEIGTRKDVTTEKRKLAELLFKAVGVK